jgi:signal transduction histidine kinase
MFPLDSLRQKIVFGYYAIGTLVIGLALLAYLELRLIEQRVEVDEHVGAFFDATLELRRFEKNYLLYRQEADQAETERYVQRLIDMLRDHGRAFAALPSAGQLDELQDEVLRYRVTFRQYTALPPDSAAADEVEQRIRHSGKALVTAAEGMAQQERQLLRTGLQRVRDGLLVSILVLATLAALLGRALARRVGRPLQEMEANMEAVANGRLAKLDIPFTDREMLSLTQAFNHVLAELELRQHHLVRSEKLASLGTLLSGVAHEMNNPLSNISSSCQILLEEPELDPEFRRELLDQIDRQTIRARNIVRSLLDFARDREFRRERLKVAPLVEETLRFLKGQVPTGIAVSRDIAPDLAVDGDKQRLQQVLLNLIKNAIEASGPRGTVAISARIVGGDEPFAVGYVAFGRCEPAHQLVEIAVADNGSGIPAEILPRIFDPFFTTKEIGKGSGLGLFVAFEIIEEHGGCIAVRSAPDAGTAIALRLSATQHTEHTLS